MHLPPGGPSAISPTSLGRNRLSSQLRASGQIPLGRWIHSSAPRSRPQIEVDQGEGAHEAQNEARETEERLTGAARLFAEALKEEEEEASRPKRLGQRSSVAVDDSPIWTGEESTRDAVLRMLVDSRKPLRGDFRSADVRMKEIIKGIDTTPIVRSRSSPSSTGPNRTSATSKQDGDRDDIVPPRPVSAAIERERAIPASEFRPWHASYVTNERSTGTPQILYGKFINASSSHGTSSLLDRPALPTDPKARKAALENRKTGERIGRLEGAREGALDYRLGGGSGAQGHQVKGSSAAGGGVRGGPSGMRAWGNLVEDRIERARANGWFDNVSGRGKPLASDEAQRNPHIDRSEFFMNRIIKKQGAKPPWIEVLQELEHAHESFRTTLMASYTRSLVRSLVTSPFHDYNSLAGITSKEAEGLRDGKWKEREAAYHAEAMTQLNSVVRKLNNIAPQPVRRGLVSLEDELRRMYALSGPVIVEELAKRRAAEWNKVGGVGGGGDGLRAGSSGGMAGDGDWDIDMGIVKGVKRLLNKTGLFRIHVLGVGAIGTLLASHLRRHLQPPEEYPITLMIKRQGLPDFTWPSKFSGGEGRNTRTDAKITPARPITLALESGGSTLVNSDFDCEVVGPAVARVEEGLDRLHSFGQNAAALARQAEARAAVKASPYLARNGSIQCLIVTLKCPQTLDAIREIRHRLDPESVIVLLQNGMGVYDQLCKEVWPDPRSRPDFVLGSTTHGAAISHQRREAAVKHSEGNERDPSSKELLHRLVVHHGRGDIKLGVVPDPRGEIDYGAHLFPTYSPTRSSLVALPPSPSLPLPNLSRDPTSESNLSRILAILVSLTPLSASLLPITLMQSHLLLKVCVNCAINPITAILGVRNGALLDSTSRNGRWARSRIRKISRECSEVLTAHLSSLAGGSTQGARVDARTGTPAIPNEMRELFSAASLERRILSVCADTASNTSSMLSDVQAGRPTEIDYINGYIIGIGERLGVSTRWNEEMRRIIKIKTGEAAGKNVEKIRLAVERERGREERRLTRRRAADTVNSRSPSILQHGKAESRAGEA